MILAYLHHTIALQPLFVSCSWVVTDWSFWSVVWWTLTGEGSHIIPCICLRIMRLHNFPPWLVRCGSEEITPSLDVVAVVVRWGLSRTRSKFLCMCAAKYSRDKNCRKNIAGKNIGNFWFWKMIMVNLEGKKWWWFFFSWISFGINQPRVSRKCSKWTFWWSFFFDIVW